MLSKVQLFDASQCANLSTIDDCTICTMYNEDDCVVALAITAIELKLRNERLEHKILKLQEKYMPSQPYIDFSKIYD